MSPQTILISQRLIRAADTGEAREALASDWGKLFALFNVVPIPILCDVDLSLYWDLAPRGVILSGGNDLSRIVDDADNARRDRFETRLLQEACARSVPVLGVCRGMQLIAQVYGSEVVALTGHAGTPHSVDIADDARRSGLVPGRQLVNSYHQYGLSTIVTPLRALAVADDGTIEALVHTEHNVLGMMWHPEREPVDCGVIEKFFRLGKR